jgi:hypothetical protein
MTRQTIGVLAFAMAMSTGCRCPTVAGPTAPAVTVTVTLAPNEFRVYDVPTPQETTQINVRVTWIPGVAVWQVESTCPVESAPQCPRLTQGTPLSGPAQAQTIGLGGRVTGDTARFVVQNLSGAEITLTLTLAPWRAGCT